MRGASPNPAEGSARKACGITVHRARRAEQIFIVAVTAAIVDAVVVLTGWLLEIEVLKGLRPGWATMKTNAAVGVLLAGSSLLLLRGAHPARGKVITARTLAIVVLILGALTLSQDLFGWNLGIDQFLLEEKRVSPATFSPNRMPPITALSFVLLGLALLLRSRSDSYGWGAIQGLAISVGAMSYLPLLGYMYAASYVLWIPRTTAMALPTALAFVLLSVAILCSRPHEGIIGLLVSEGLGGSLARRLLPAAVLVPTLLGLLERAGVAAGLYDTSFGLAALVACAVLLFAGVIWRSAAALNELDAERLEAMRKMEVESKAREFERRRLQVVLDVMPVGVFLTDASGRVTDINETAKTIWGKCALGESGIPENGGCGAPGPDTEAAARLDELGMARLLTHGEVRVAEEVDLETAGGRRKTILNYSAPFRDERGAIAGGVAVNVDITERKLAEQALRESEALVRTIAENSTHALFMMDEHGYCTYCNRACREMTGYTERELRSKPLHELIHHHHPDGRPYPMSECPIDRALPESFDVRAHEDVFFRKDGTAFPVVCAASPIFRDGRPVSTVIEVRDVTREKSAELALRESEERFRGTFDNAAVGIAHVGMDGRWLRVNDRLCAITGYSRDQLLSRTVQDITHPEDPREDLEYVRQVLAGTIRTYSMEKRYIRGDGKTTWVNLTVSLMRRASGEPRFFIAVIEDITGRKEAEMELRALRDELEERVRHRTAELTAANSELEAFSYSVSHDLRAPLRWVDGFTQALAEDYSERLDETGRDYIRQIRESVQRMSELIEALLKLSRITRAPLERTDTDLSRAAREIASELEASATSRRVTWEIADNIHADADPKLVHVLLDNLLRNAWKFTRTREVARIQVGVTSEDGERAYFVRDNGVGFDMVYAGKLFRAFERLHRAEEFEGTGVGLALVRRIVQRHGGLAWARGQPNEGATFFFTLGPPRGPK